MYFENPEIELKELHSAIIGTLIEKNYFDNFCRKEEEQEKIREQGWWSAPAIYKKGIFRSDRNNVHPYGGELEEMGIIEIKWIEYEDTWGRKKKKKKMFRIIKSKKVKMLLFENLASIYFSRNPPTKKKLTQEELLGVGFSIVAQIFQEPYKSFFELDDFGHADYLFNEKIKSNNQKIKNLQKYNKELEQLRDKDKQKNKRRKGL
tara:strand:- start:965 stop:1579 length:615 start_codon:yes stop_codon:yes gene_type:complete